MHFLKEEIRLGNLTIDGFYTDWANPTYQIVRILVFAFMLVVIFPYLPGSDSPVFQGVSVFLGFLFTFGSAGSLSNIVAGLIITYMRAFKLGDRVKNRGRNRRRGGKNPARDAHPHHQERGNYTSPTRR